MKPSEFLPEYEQLLLRAAHALQSNSEFAVQFTTDKIVNSVQARFRAYVRSLKSTGDRPDLTAAATNISTRVAGTALIFFRREDSVDAMAIRDALGLSPGFADGSDTRGVIAPNTHLDRLREIRNRK